MKFRYLAYLALSVVFFGGCTQATLPYMNKETKTVAKNFSFVNGVVVADFGQDIVVELGDDLNIFKENHYSSRLANAVVSNSLFLVGQKTYLDEFAAEVKDIRGSQVTFTLKEDIPMVANMKVKIYLPKKKIAILDFGVKEHKNSDGQKIAMNELITKLVQSGQYVVVEREKIDTILEEHKLIDSGLLEMSEVKKLGKLVSADVVLTGSLLKSGSNWNVYLRLIDVSTGVIVGAIKETISLREFNPLQKNSDNITENFDGELGKGWVVSPKTEGYATAHSSIDTTAGANQSARSLKINFTLGDKNSGFGIFNNIARDLSTFQGIKFWAKADFEDVVLTVRLKDINKDDAQDNVWQARMNVSKSWREYSVAFSELYLAQGYAKRNPGGDGILDLDMVKAIIFAIQGDVNFTNSQRTLWIDEITLY